MQRVEHLPQERLFELLGTTDVLSLIKTRRVKLEPAVMSNGWMACLRHGQKKYRYKQFGETLDLAVARCLVECRFGNPIGAKNEHQ